MRPWATLLTAVCLAGNVSGLPGGARYAIAYEIGETILIDDFNDGNDDGWSHHDYLGGPPAGPGTFDPNSGAYSLTSAGPAQPGASLFATWDGSTDPQLSSGLVRGKVRANTEGTVAWLLMRGDLTTNYYLFLGSTSSGRFFIQRNADELIATLDDPNMPFTVGNDWIFQGGAVGDQLSLKVWQSGEPEPAAPQLTVIDPNAHGPGFLGVGANVSPQFGEPAVVDATFDDIYFTFIPEPSTLALAAAGLLGLVASGLRRWRQPGLDMP